MKRLFELLTPDFHSFQDPEGHLHHAIMKPGLVLVRPVSLTSKDWLFLYVQIFRLQLGAEDDRRHKRGWG
jgi:hypothetical protein